ncbi:hypothetical protein [Thioclava sp. GXIMD4216]|uniref:Uncharacterized protein n=1 Tax=Thioclava litoralis TaxID=3076557 RepID=A0ABZ1DY05_9RHOB|nr:hypothetical protein RPE78_11470 [Thioclava sp. FTW29]
MSDHSSLPRIAAPRYTLWAAGCLASGLSILWLGLFVCVRLIT